MLREFCLGVLLLEIRSGWARLPPCSPRLMKPHVLLAEVATPAGDQLALYSHDDNFFLKANGVQLMTSAAQAPEEELARLGCAPLRPATQPHVLIGGLGLGFTLTEACRTLPQKGARFTVAEVIPELVTWNRTHLAHLHPGVWEDPRVAIHRGEVRDLIGRRQEAYNVILLDADNGPEAFQGKNNDVLYTLEGLQQLSAALKAGGILAIWSASGDPGIEQRLSRAGFEVSRAEVPAAHRGQRKRRHIIWIARNGEYQPKRHSQKP
jgi:spermidine synthase